MLLPRVNTTAISKGAPWSRIRPVAVLDSTLRGYCAVGAERWPERDGREIHKELRSTLRRLTGYYR